MILKNLNILGKNGFKLQDIAINDETGRIEKIGQIKEKGQEFDGERLIPGLVDPHTHGGNGYDFNSAKSLSEMQHILDFYIRNGVTSVLPTIMTDSDEIIKRKLAMVAELAKTNPVIIGIHLEGPFLSEEFKGAQPKEYLQPLKIEKFDEYQKCAHGLIKYITISPELAGTARFTKDLVAEGIHVSLGHSGATFDQTVVALKEGANGFTHTFNAMKPISQHEPSILAAATYFDDDYCELILDGIHVVSEMVLWLFHIKGYEHIIGITDSLMPAGLPNGNYYIGSTPITVKDGDCKITGTTTRAGSTLKAIEGFRNVKRFAGLTDREASAVYSSNFARMMGMQKDIGFIEEGNYANFIILDQNDGVLHSFIHSKQQF